MTFIYRVLTFYIAFLVLLGLGGLTTAQVEFPTFPDFDDTPPSAGLSIVGFTFLLIEFLAYFFILMGFFVYLIAFTFTDILPVWLSLIIFLPLAITLIYEVTARLIRGS